jgi:hypothetical protein
MGKLPVSLEEAETHVKLFDSAALTICGSHLSPVNSLRTSSPETAIIKPTVSRAKMVSIKTKLGRVLHKLYDLESDNAPEKPLNLDLPAGLYQMENF